jgi:hypothetical protein
MQFDPTVHTKTFLSENINVLKELAKSSPDFAKSELCNDVELLSVPVEKTFVLNKFFTQHTLAHFLAEHQPAWLQSPALKDINILQIANYNGRTVAHYLAQNQADWLKTDEANNFEVLKITDFQGWTVAHSFAHKQADWIKSDAAKDLDILKLTNSNNWTVAHILIEFQARSVYHSPLFHKEILCIERQPGDSKDQLLAKYFSERRGDSGLGLDEASMVMKLIAQGAAYKDPEPMLSPLGHHILKETSALVIDACEPLIALKQLLAFYSTVVHNVSKLPEAEQNTSSNRWQGIKASAEQMLRQHLCAHPELFDIEHTVDYYCEPGDIFLKHLGSERVLNSTLVQIDDSINSTEIAHIKQGIY